ncbi:alpha/beta hydrolase [Actinobacteria bacterium YIM 96077]|uniref:Alpha/beta hydrolase n=1 Tax=Phytoactinopolyspora halophila TaxID=1981511 RepID=A0A329QCX4_9ACTN|nr:alpha/beta hydrolase [Phytoactinopolyspora halophila]AYY14012.1 alpha/beta hydrolase [Actinobacteria bacterium YIM 96077]RAW10263.1 alpha/beta hydrolase [Phytoactinopolyspora halophila]
MPARSSALQWIAIPLLAASTAAATALSAQAQPGEPPQPAETTESDGQIEAPVPELDWQSCGEGLEHFLCATAEVPTDYDDPAGPTTSIALTKLPATEPDSRIGTLFTNPGGPGGSGVEFVHTMGTMAFTDDVRQHFDILGFDPRGVAGSDPATCYRTLNDELEATASLPAFPVTDTEERRYQSTSIRLSVNCRMTSRERFEHASTANVARDMDLLRQAVGDDQLTYMGYSYGTFLGATYAKLFPDQVRALALDGAIVPEDYAGEPGEESATVGERLKQGPGASATFAEFLRLCADAGPQRCALAALGDPETVVNDTFEWLRTEPAEIQMPDGSTITVTYATAVTLTFQNLYEPAGWAAHAELLAQLATEDAELSDEAGALVERSLPDPSDRRRRGEDYDSVGSALASVCTDTGTTGDPFSYAERADAADEKAPHFGRFRAWTGLNCEYMRITDDDAYTGPWEQDVDSPVLVIGTRFDPATPYESTQPYADHFPDAHILTVDGWGHTILNKSSCADEAVGAYLVELETPEEGSTCPQDITPFAGGPSTLDEQAPQVPRIPLPQLTTPATTSE